jgi:NADH dehydrogenase FAD-containing subunit
VKKRRRLALLLLLVLLALASYGGESVAAQGGGDVEDRAEINIIVVTHGQASDPFWSVVANGIQDAAADLGVRVHEGSRVEEVSPEGPVRADGRLVPADTTVWTAGFRVPELARTAGLEVTGTGRMVVDEGLRSVSHPEVYGVGDAAAAQDRLLHCPAVVGTGLFLGMADTVVVAGGDGVRLLGPTEVP